MIKLMLCLRHVIGSSPSQTKSGDNYHLSAMPAAELKKLGYNESKE